MADRFDEKNAFILYKDSYALVEKLSDEEAGRLLKALFKYANTGEKDESLSGAVDMAYTAMLIYIDRDNEKWQAQRRRRVEAGRAGGRAQRKQSQETPSNAKQSEQSQAKLSNAKQCSEVEQKTLYGPAMTDVKELNLPREKLRELWNSICVNFSPVRGINGERERLLRTRWKEHPDLDWWSDYFLRIANSGFLSGRTSDWKATFDWVLKAPNMDKILEGRYDDKEKDDGKDERDDPEFWTRMPTW